MSDRTPMTVIGRTQLETELKRLKSVDRPSVIQAIDEARQHGDLSENAEYSAAKERQSFIEGRIQEIEGKLARADVIDPKTLKGSKVVFGATVGLTDENGNSKTYQIVGEDEADLKQNRISIHAPLAKAILGREPGDLVEVRAPKGNIQYEVVSVSFL